MLLRRLVPALATLVVLSACALDSSGPAAGSRTPTPAPAPRCQGDDHVLDVPQLGWSFCYPSSWHYRERDVPTTAPAGIDTTLDVVGDQGFFGFMIIGSYDRKGATSLRQWLADNEPDDQQVTPIQWGNAIEAAQVSGQLRRYALTKNRVYLLSEREGAGNLDLDAEMSKRLGAWVFSL